MRYSSVQAFFKQLKDSIPKHLCKIYTIFSEDDFERKKIVEKSAYLISSEAKLLHEAGMERLLYEASSPSLFSSSIVIASDFSSKISKNDLSLLLTYLQRPKQAVMVLGFPSKEGLEKIFPLLEGEGVITELLGRAAKEERMLGYLAAKAKSLGKKISKEVALELIERSKKDFALLVQESEKLFTYVGEKENVSFEDLTEICSTKEATLWQMAERLIWEQRPIDIAAITDSDFHLLHGILRHELRLGMKLWDREIASSLGIWPWLLEKRKRQAKNFSREYFLRGLYFLYEMEILCKDGVMRYDALLLQFISFVKSYAHTPS